MPEEIYPHKLSKLNADKVYGDIDVMAIDHDNKIIFSIECKNSTGARNIIETVGEMNTFLCREGGDEIPKIQKHVNRDTWLKKNIKMLSGLVKDPETYTIKSFVLTADKAETFNGLNKLLP